MARFDLVSPGALQAPISLRISVLGPLQVTRGADNLTPSSDVARRLVTALAARAGEELSSDELVEIVYSSEPTRALRKRLQAVVYRLRGSLLGEGRLLATTDRGYRFAALPGTVDIEDFERLARSGRELLHAGAPHDAAGALRAALDLWRGAPLADLAVSGHVERIVTRLSELRYNTVEDWAEAALAIGRPLPAVDELAPLVDAHPMRERAWALAIRARTAAGQHDAARRGFEQAYRHLADAGLEPGAELRDAGAACSTDDTSRSAPAVAPFPAALRAVLTHPPLTGREQELEQGRHMAESVRAESSVRLLLLSGEAGIGKTRLAAEIARSAFDAGAAVWLGECDPYVRVPYSPFVQIARELLRREPAAETQQRVAGPLAYFAPDLVTGGYERVARDPDTERYLLFEEVSALLLDVAAASGAALVIDGLHWAPASTLLLLAHLLRAAQSAPLLVIATYRNTETALSHEHDELIRRLEQHSATHWMQLRGLGREDLARLVDGGRDASAPPRWSLDDLERLTAGNPLYAIGLTRRGLPDGPEDEPAALTRGLRRIVDDHLSHLPELSTRVIEALAVLGDEADIALVATAVSAAHDDLVTDDANAAIDQAVSAGVVQRTGDADDRIAFTHGVVREVVYEGLPQALRHQLHLVAGEALEATALASRRSSSVHQLAWHFRKAGPICDPYRKARWARAAGDDAARALAFDDAASWYEEALTAFDAAPSPAEAERFDVLLALGRTREELDDFEAGDSAFAAAAELAESMGWSDRLALAALHHGGSWVRLRPHDRYRARSLLRAAQLSLGGASELRGAVERRLNDAEQPAREAHRWPSHDTTSVFGSDATLAVLAERWWYELGTPRLEVAREIVDRAQARDDRTAHAMGLLYEWIARISLGQATLHDPVQDDIESRMHEIASPHARWIWSTWKAGHAMAAGRFAESERRIQSAYERALLAPVVSDERPASPGFLAAVRTTQLLLLCFNYGRYAEMEQLLAGMPSMWASRLQDMELVAMVLAARRSNPSTSIARLRQLVDGVSDYPRDATWPPRLAMLAIVCSDLDDARSASALAAELEQLRGTRVIFLTGLCGATAEHHLGRLAITGGDPTRAVELLELAEAQHEWFGSPPAIALARFWRSHALRQLGGVERVAEADRLLHAVHEAASRYDMRQFVG